MSKRFWISTGVVAIIIVGRALFKHLGWHDLYVVFHFLTVLAAYYMWLECLGVWDFLLGGPLHPESDPNKEAAPKEPPPTGYTGPFWNKPSANFLHANYQPFTFRQEISVYVTIIIVFIGLATLLLRR